MQLRNPDPPYRPDPGRSLSPEEIAAAQVTPLTEIVCKTCKLLGKGDRHRGTIGN